MLISSNESLLITAFSYLYLYQHLWLVLSTAATTRRVRVMVMLPVVVGRKVGWRRSRRRRAMTWPPLLRYGGLARTTVGLHLTCLSLLPYVSRGVTRLLPQNFAFPPFRYTFLPAIIFSLLHYIDCRLWCTSWMDQSRYYIQSRLAIITLFNWRTHPLERQVKVGHRRGHRAKSMNACADSGHDKSRSYFGCYLGT